MNTTKIIFSACVLGLTAAYIPNPDFVEPANQETGIILYQGQEVPPFDSYEVEKTQYNESETTSLEQTNNEHIKGIVDYLKSLLIDAEIETSGKDYLADALHNIKINKEDLYYKLFDSFTSANNFELIKAVLFYLSNVNFNQISIYEECFVVNCLKSNVIDIQYFALNTLLEWGETTLIKELESVFIDNKYLQNDLNDFLEAQE